MRDQPKKHVAEVLHGVGVEVAFIGAGVQVIFSETSEDLTGMFMALFHDVQVDEDVGEDIIHEAFKSCWCIS